ncbi:hypothetical protein HYT45_03655 [Candidatus Uhrbacteria bacterium]|nr:hypothetical protein [Candidatus Uhrbacteria bacterium]
MAPEAKKQKQSILAEHFWSTLALAAILMFGGAYLAYFKNEIARFKPGGIFDAGRVKKELEARGEELAKLKSAVAALNSISMEDREKIERFFPPIPDEPSIIASVSQMARASGLVLLSIDAAGTGEPRGKFPKGLKAVEITMGAGGGNYIRLKTFLEALEVSIRLFDIQSLAYAPASNAYSIRLRAYYLE